MPDRQSPTALLRSTDDATGAFVAAGTPTVADGIGNVIWGGATASSSGMVPYYIAADDTFTVPLYKQALFAEAIEADGALVVNGILMGVD